MKRIFNQSFVLFVGLIAWTLQAEAQYNSSEFGNTVPIPYMAEGTTTAGTTAVDLTFAAFMHNFDPNGMTTNGLPEIAGSKTVYKIDQSVRTWGINSTSRAHPTSAPDMTYLGPTVKWMHGNQINMQVTNNLPSNSSTEPGQGQTTTSHWHGLNVHAQGDGGPHQPIPNSGPNNPWKPSFPMVDPAQTLWYHSHVMAYTTEQVIMGAAGMIIVEDETDATTKALNAALPHDYNQNDFPLVLQEKGFVYDTIKRNDSMILTAKTLNVSEKPGDGQFRIINGVALGQLKVPASMVRLRVLNGDPRKSFNIGFSTDIDPTNTSARLTFYQVASDGGYMAAAHGMTEFLINPGERGEFVVDFGSGNLGSNTEVFMSNITDNTDLTGPKDLVGLGAGKNNGYEITPGYAFMKFVVDNSISPTTPITTLPEASKFPKYELLSCDNPNKRKKRLMGGNGKTWTIDGKPMKMDTLNDIVCVNTCEEWTIVNETAIAHPFHIHKVQFQITEYVDRSDTNVNPSNPAIKTYTYPNLPSYMMGFKDVMIVRAYSTMKFQARFDDFGADEIDPKNGYMYHCHILTHEDHSMMHQFTVVSDSVCKIVHLREKEAETSALHLYPNPAENTLHLQGKSDLPGTIQFVDLTGRVIAEQKVAPFSGEIQLDVADLPRGLVLINYTRGAETFTQKVLLE